MTKILFIGNSHTYFNDMPALVAELFEQVLGQEIHVTMLASPGVPLRWHIDQPQTAFNILHGGYDYVVLQQATHPFDGEEALMRQAAQLLELIRQAKATPVAYMTWAKEESPDDQAELTAAFERLAAQENMLLAPAGVVWEKVRAAVPDAPLYWRDKRHASPLGSALAAVSIFRAITGASLPEADSSFWAERGGTEQIVATAKAVLAEYA